MGKLTKWWLAAGLSMMMAAGCANRTDVETADTDERGDAADTVSSPPRPVDTDILEAAGTDTGEGPFDAGGKTDTEEGTTDAPVPSDTGTRDTSDTDTPEEDTAAEFPDTEVQVDTVSDGDSEGGAVADLRIVEVYPNHVGQDDGYEWVKLHNAGSGNVALSGWFLGWGGDDYTYGRLALSGTVAAGGCLVVGGPSFPQGEDTAQRLEADLKPDLQNGGAVADGVALLWHDGETELVLDAVIYGDVNDNGLSDETGGIGAVDGPAPKEGQSLRRGVEGGFEIRTPVDPFECAF